MTPRAAPLLVAFLAAPAAALAQPVYALRAGGDVYQVSRVSGAASLWVSTGVQANAALTWAVGSGRGGHADIFFLAGAPGPQADQILYLSGGVFLTTTGRPPGFTLRSAVPAISYYPSFLYALLVADNPASSDLLATISVSSGQYGSITTTGATDLESIALSAGGELFALGSASGGTLYHLSLGGPAVPIASGGFGDSVALGAVNEGTLLAAGSNLYSVNPSTGATTLIGPTGITGIRALAVVHSCYVNCDGGGPPPSVNVADFTCFLQKFAAGDPWANCDESVTPPVINVSDFTCFLQKFAAGCTTP
jgi:hypothetical protein